MNRYKIIPKYIAGLLAILFFLCAFPVGSIAASSQDDGKTVRIAYPLQYGITEVDKNGTYCGYTYEYLMEIAQYTGWKYEFVQVPGDINEQITTLMEMVKNGEVDFMGATYYNETLAQQYDYSGYSYGTVETVLKTLVNGGPNVVIDASRMQTLRIATLSKSGKQIDDLKEYCKMNLIDPVLVQCASEEELLQSIKDGRADVLLTTSMYYDDALRTVSSFSPRQFYFITCEKNNSGLLAKLNEAMQTVNELDPYFQSSLFSKYFAPETRELVLSDKEKEYIKNCGKLQVGVLKNQPPFQYINSDGEITGIGVELLRQISEKIGLTYNLVETTSLEELYQLSAEGKIDIVAGMPYNYTIAQDKNLSMTRPYVTGQYILLLNDRVSENELNGKRLAIPKSGGYTAASAGEEITFDTIEECIHAVNSGKADFTYAVLH